MNGTELRATISLAAIFAARLLGLFMIYPIFAQYARGLSGADNRTDRPRAGGLWIDAGPAANSFRASFRPNRPQEGDRRRPAAVRAGQRRGGHVHLDQGRSARPHLAGGRRRRIVDPGHGGGSHPRGGANPRHGRGRNHHRLFLRARRSRRPAARRRRRPVGHVLVTAVFALAGVAITLLVTPTPVHAVSRGVGWSTFKRVLQDGELLRLDFAVFILHAILTASFLVIPFGFASGVAFDGGGRVEILPAGHGRGHGADGSGDHRRRDPRADEGGFHRLDRRDPGQSGGSRDGAGERLGRRRRDDRLFFTAFNAMEAMLPSLVTKFAPPAAKGAATGVFSSSQFVGIFVGGAAGGLDASRERRFRRAWPDCRAVADLACRRGLHASSPAAPAPDGSCPGRGREGLIRIPNESSGIRMRPARKSPREPKDFRAMTFPRIAKQSCGNRMTAPDFTGGLWRVGQDLSYIALARNFARPSE